jgi:flavodoxin I
MFGIPTWYYGEAQCDWEEFFPVLKTINFKGKSVALFGCGDQEDYSEYFCDALGLIHSIIEPNGAKFVGKWSTKGYVFEASKGLLNQDNFLGLAIDEDRQPELTSQRIKDWISQVSEELSLNNMFSN